MPTIIPQPLRVVVTPRERSSHSRQFHLFTPPEMRTKKTTLNYPDELHPAVVKRAKDAGYPNITAYFIGLVRYDLMTCKPHTVTAELSKLNFEEQDRIDLELARMFDAGETVNGSWFERTLAECVAEAGAEGSESKAVDRFLSRLRNHNHANS